MKRSCCKLILALSAVVALGLAAGCGGGGGDVQPRQADVAIVAAVTAHPADAPSTPNVIDGVVVSTADAGDTIDVTNARARIERADGSSAAVSLDANADGTQVTMGQATVTPSTTEFNTLVINGPVRFQDGDSGTTTTLGRVEFRFEVLASGGVVSPDTLRVNIPTSGAATDRRVIVTGLSPNPVDYVKTIILDNQGGITESSVHGANAQGTATLRDAQGSITAAVLSGNNSRISMLFARTDTNADGEPDLFD